jgi:hypothetical protein
MPPYFGFDVVENFAQNTSQNRKMTITNSSRTYQIQYLEKKDRKIKRVVYFGTILCSHPTCITPPYFTLSKIYVGLLNPNPFLDFVAHRFVFDTKTHLLIRCP